MIEMLLESFAMLFVTLNPVSTAVVFAGASASEPAPVRNRVAVKSVLTAFGILLVFAIGGDDILRAVGVRLFALKVAGGVMLFLFGVGKVMGPKKGPDQGSSSRLEDQTVFPLAMPIMAGPASILTMVILIKRVPGEYLMQGLIIGIMALIMLITLALLMISGKVARFLGDQGNEILSRILGLLLAALAVEMIFDGLALSGIVTPG